MKYLSTYLKAYVWLVFLVLLSGCATITGVGKDNTPKPSPLLDFNPRLHPQKMWSSQAGKGSEAKYLSLVPVLNNNTIFTADDKGHVTALARQNGKIMWQADLKVPLVAGPGVGENSILVGDNQANLYALTPFHGTIRWHIHLTDQLLAPPVIANDIAIVKTLDGRLWGIDISNGHILWQRTHNVPVMVLASGSRPQIAGNKVIIGYADGKLDAYSLTQGQLLWEISVAQPQGAADVEQMIDIAADPAISNNVIYVVTYQGNLTAVNATTGSILWQQPLSSYTGLALSDQAVFVTDTESIVHAYNRYNGQLLWQQDNLKYRQLTAAVVMGDAIVVGDGEGYLHWLSQANGTTLARVTVKRNTPILARPLVDGDNLYVINAEGLAAAYHLIKP